MPQMMPMLWFWLMMSCFLLLSMSISLMYFNNLYLMPNLKNLSNLSVKNYDWKWKW